MRNLFIYFCSLDVCCIYFPPSVCLRACVYACVTEWVEEVRLRKKEKKKEKG